MKLLPTTIAFLALVGAVVAVLLLVLADEGPPPPVVEEALPRGAGPGPAPFREEEFVRGGVFAGRVVDREGEPIPQATVLLVAWDTGEGVRRTQPTDLEDWDPSMLGVVGHRTAAQTETDAGGRFRVAADADSAIRIVCAYHRGHVPELVAVTRPTEDLEIVLPPAGRFVGHVVDEETGRPVAFARVAIYLQQRASPVDAEIGGRVSGQDPSHRISPFAAAQRWVAKELGPRVFGLDWEGDESIRVWTDEEGRFELAPLGDEVQLEFVITHAEYMWTELDRTERDTIERTVVPPGETVERTFRLKKGKSVSGRVIDENNRGVPDVLVSVECLPQYAQHWWYRTRARRARTKRDGSFTVGGLSWGPYNVTVRHPAGGSEVASGVPEGTKDLVIQLKSRGVIEGRIEGLEDQPFGARITLVLEAMEEIAQGARHQRRDARVESGGAFRLTEVEPGTWRVWVQAGGRSSQPQEIVVESLKTTKATFVLGGGGALVLRVWDVANSEVDPATVVLVRLLEEGREERLGRFVTRGGRLEAEGIVPGRYLAEVSAAGYLPARTETFQVGGERATDAGDVVLRRPATLRIAGILGPDGREVREAVHLSVREGEGEFRPLPLLRDPEVPVKPGVVTVRAVCDDGSTYEETFEALDGGILPVTVRLRR